MNKSELDLLEKAFALEIECASHKRPPVLQTKSKIAQKLADEGMLEHVRCELPGNPPVEFSGYVLTEIGRFIYCESCRDDE